MKPRLTTERPACARRAGNLQCATKLRGVTCGHCNRLDEALTSGEFIALWTERVNRFMARKVEPPTHYVQHATKTQKLTQIALTPKKKTKVAAIAK